jgi:hypothetical protein
MEDFELTGGQSSNAEDTLPDQGGDAAAAAPEPEFVEIKNRDDAWKVEKDLFESVADRLGMDVDRLRRAVQIGLDGARLYEEVNDERSRLAAAWEELARTRPREEDPARPAYPPQPGQRPTQRPPAEDTTGNLLWLAERFESVLPNIERVSKLEEMLAETQNRFAQSEEAQQASEEKAIAISAYEDVKNEWKKQGFGDLPSRGELERALRRFPITDDVDLTWHEVWDQIGWMTAGPMVARRQRRQAVLDNQNPKARFTVPANQAVGPTGPRPAAREADGTDNAALDREYEELSRQIPDNATLANVYGDRRPMR